MAKPWFIAVSGPIGSGKSTLALGLTKLLGWHYISERRPVTEYLSDLFKNPNRWAFETQLAFLCHKSIQIINAINSNHNIIVDRSLDEDVVVFAEYFYQKGYIEQRAYKLYKALVNHFMSELPEPDLIIYCDCSLDTIRARIETRKHGFQEQYPPNFLKDTRKFYDNWLGSDSYAAIYSVDSEKVDWRQPATLKRIAGEIRNILTCGAIRPQQLELFEDAEWPPSIVNKREESFLHPVHEHRHLRIHEGKIPLTQGEGRQKPTLPTAYIAAPFTTKAEIEHITDKEATFFELSPSHGQILRGKYRNMLLSVRRTIHRMGISCVLPHEDVNEWGNKSLSSTKVVDLCTLHVRDCDLFISILGESHGSHYEFGIAVGMNKPCVAINCKEITNSFIADGVSEGLGNVLVLNCEKMKDVPKILDSNKVRDFISRFLPIIGKE